MKIDRKGAVRGLLRPANLSLEYYTNWNENFRKVISTPVSYSARLAFCSCPLGHW
jgi:hypothetical protein